MGIMKWIRGWNCLQLQPTDDLLGGETLGTAMLSHPLSPNIMEHDLQPQSGPSQHAAAPLRPCPDSQVWTTSQAPYLGKSHRAACARAPGPDWSRDVLCASGKGGWIGWVSEWCWPRLTPQGRRKALTRKVWVGDAAPRPLSCLQGGWYTVESPAGFQRKNMRKPGVSGTCMDYRPSPRERRVTAPLTSSNLSVCHPRLGNSEGREEMGVKKGHVFLLVFL